MIVRYKYFGYLFTISLLVLVWLQAGKKENKGPSLDVVRLGITTDSTQLSIDPAKIDNLTKALICDNIYARLVTDDNGQLSSWLAKTYYVENDAIHISLASNKTSKGTTITSEDVEATLKRLLILDTNSHAKLSKFLNCSKKIKKLSDPCDAIRIIDEYTLQLRTQSPTKAQMLLKIFAATEYGIIPKSAIHPSSLEILNHEETTGAYAISKDKLSMNKNQFFRAEKNYFNTVNFVKGDGSTSVIDMFLNNEIDIIPTTVNLNKTSAARILASNSYEIFYTDKIKLFMINFGPKILENMTNLERHHFVSKIRESMIANFQYPLETESTEQFFSVKGSGRLNPSQQFSISQQIEKSKKMLPAKKFNLRSYNGLEKSMAMLNEIQNVKVEFGDSFPPESKFVDRPDAYYMMGDISFDEDYTLLSYYLTNQIVAFDGSEADRALNKFLSTADETERANQINQLHFKMINEAYVGPLAIAPYSIVTRKPFKSSQSKMSASTKIWLINETE